MVFSLIMKYNISRKKHKAIQQFKKLLGGPNMATKKEVSKAKKVVEEKEEKKGKKVKEVEKKEEKKEKDPAKVARGKALAAMRNNGKESWGGMVKRLLTTTKDSQEAIAKKVTKAFPKGREITIADVKFYYSKLKKAGEVK